MAELTAEQADSMRRAAHAAVRETSGSVWLGSVAAVPDREPLADFTILTMNDGQKCISIPESWTDPDSAEGGACQQILNQEAEAFFNGKGAS